ncbi:HEAT repeat domain-containing protein [Petrachloros mirabilis]
MNPIILCVYLGALFMAFVPTESLAYRDYLTAEQKSQLVKIQAVRIEGIALTDKGASDPTLIVDMVAGRLGELGYTVVRETGKPHDAVFRVKCEERKTWEGTTAAGGDADLPDAPSRLWKGPACQLTYLLGETKIRWQKEVRTDFEDPTAAALAANAGDHSGYAIAKLLEKLEEYDFPILLAAEWGQPERLLKLLDNKGTPPTRKIKIISLLGQMQADEALPKLKEALQDRELNREAAVALGNLGSEGIPILVDILKTSNQPDLQAAAAKGLGKIGGITGDGRVVDPLLSMLDAPGIDIRVQTEIVWALGKIPDKRALAPLKALYKKVLHIRDPENKELQSLKEALNWSTKQLDMDEHLS